MLSSSWYRPQKAAIDMSLPGLHNGGMSEDVEIGAGPISEVVFRAVWFNLKRLANSLPNVTLTTGVEDAGSVTVLACASSWRCKTGLMAFGSKSRWFGGLSIVASLASLHCSKSVSQLHMKHQR